MDALTLTQPWATLMIARRSDTGIPSKRIESRNWAPTAATALALYGNANGDGAAEVRGRRLGLHAAKAIDKKIRKRISNGLMFEPPYAAALVACGYSPYDPWMKDYQTHVDEAPLFRDVKMKPLPLGAMLGIITLDRVMRGRDVEALCKAGAPLLLDRGVISDLDDVPSLFGNYAQPIDYLELMLGSYDETNETRYGWVVRDSVELPAPISTRGYQKLWKIPDDVFAQMAASHA